MTVQSLLDSGWRELLAASPRDGYLGAYQAFRNEARLARSSGDNSRADALELLSAVCSMHLKRGSYNAPFGALIVMPTWRTTLPEDLRPELLSELVAFAESIDDPLLRARVFDVAWIRLSPRRPADAGRAIEAYRALAARQPEDAHETTEYLVRALELAKMLNRQDDRAAIVEGMAASVVQKRSSAVTNSRLLLEFRERRADASLFANALSEEAARHTDAGDFLRAQDYLIEATKWAALTRDRKLTASVASALASAYESEALARVSGESPSHIAALHFYERAIQTLRTIPRSLRASLGIALRIEALLARLAESGELSLEEMGQISTGEIDISDMVAGAKAAVRDRPLAEALLRLARISQLHAASQLHATAEELAKNSPLRLLMGGSSISCDGRIVAKRPGLPIGDSSGPEHAAVLRAEMIQHYQILIGLAVEGRIVPALQVINLEHVVHEADLLFICERSPIVPRGRERAFARGLLAGFDRDFLVAAHVLAPQVENLVRWHLQKAGVRTTVTDENGITQQMGLGALMALPQTATIIGENCAFEIEALFCDANGPNLRNDIAHGLVDDDAAFSRYSVYAWWLVLHLVVSTFWHSVQEQRPEPPVVADESKHTEHTTPEAPPPPNPSYWSGCSRSTR